LILEDKSVIIYVENQWDGYFMNYDNTYLPKRLSNYLDEIYNNKELNDAFFECDIELYEPELIKNL